MFREQSFVPHSFRCDARFLPGRGPKKMPKIIMSRKAYSLMWAYVDEGQEEVGWLGTAYRQQNGDFRIEEVFLFKQTVSATETEISTEGLSELAMELIQSGEKGMDACNNLRFWGHSHVRMGTSASGTDENTMVKSSYGSGGSYGRSTFCFQNDQVPWAVRGIFNKEGRAQFSIFLYEEGLRIDDVAWDVDAPPAKPMAVVSASAPVIAPPPLPDLCGPVPVATLTKQPRAEKPAQTGAATAAETEGEAVAEITEETAEQAASKRSEGRELAPVRPKYGFFSRPSPDPRYLPDITVEMRAAIRSEFMAKVKSRGCGWSFWSRNRSNTADDQESTAPTVAADDGVAGDFGPAEERAPELTADWTTAEPEAASGETVNSADSSASEKGTGSGSSLSSSGGAASRSCGSKVGSVPPVVSPAHHRLENLPRAGCACDSCIKARGKESPTRTAGVTAKQTGPDFAQSESRVAAFFRALGKAIIGN